MNFEKEHHAFERWYNTLAEAEELGSWRGKEIADAAWRERAEMAVNAGDYNEDVLTMVPSDRSMNEIKAALSEAKGKEHLLYFSAKEVRGLLFTIINQEARIERFEKKIADHIAQYRKMRAAIEKAIHQEGC